MDTENTTANLSPTEMDDAYLSDTSGYDDDDDFFFDPADFASETDDTGDTQPDETATDGTEGSEPGESDTTQTDTATPPETAPTIPDSVSQELQRLRFENARLDAEYRNQRSVADAHSAFIRDVSTQQGVTVEMFMDRTRAAMVAEQRGIEFDAALSEVRQARREQEVIQKESALAAQQQSIQFQAAQQQRRQQEVTDFQLNHPTVNMGEIPQSVWDDAKSGAYTLETAYAKHDAEQQLAQARAQLELVTKATEQNQKNAARALGSQSTAGAKQELDAFELILLSD